MDTEFGLRIFIIITCWIVAYQFSTYAMRRKSWVLGSYSLTALIVGAYHASKLAITNYEFSEYLLFTKSITGWSHIIAISVLYCGLAHLIREDKPKVARFPIYFTGLPLLIIISYPFAHEMKVIDQWLFQIYEGGALFVSILIYGYQSIKYKRNYYYKVLSGIGLLLISYLTFWFFASLEFIQPWIWQLSLAAGIILFYRGYRDALDQDI